MKKNILNIILIFVIGGMAGVIFSNILLPKLSNVGVFSGIGWLKNLKDQTVIVNKTEEIHISESEILSSVIEKNRSSEVIVKSFRNNNLISSGSGFIVSSDGLILTRREVVLQTADKIVVTQGGEDFSAEISKSMDDFGLVLLKSNISNLPVVSFTDSASNIPLGTKVILIGSRNLSLEEIKFLKENKVTLIKMDLIEEDIQEVCDLVMERARNSGGFYLSVDIKSVDPGFAPGTMEIEPGGLGSRELIYFVKRLSLLDNFKGGDIVEINPEKDINNMTVKLGAKLLGEMI